MKRRTIGSLGQTINPQGRRTVDQQSRWRTINWQGQGTVNQSQSQFQLHIIVPITDQMRLPYHDPIGLQFRSLQRQS